MEAWKSSPSPSKAARQVHAVIAANLCRRCGSYERFDSAKTGGSTVAADSPSAESPQDSKVHATRQAADTHSNETSADAGDAEKKPGMPKSQTGLRPGRRVITRPPWRIGRRSVSRPFLPGQADGVHRDGGSRTPRAAGFADERYLRALESTQGQNVDVRIVQRAGDLQIAVKTADNVTTQGLRQGLSELTNRLNESGYQAESWRPGHSAAAAESTGDSGNSSHHQPPSGNSQSNSGWSQQNQGQRDNNPSNRPRWIEELESNLDGGNAQQDNFMASSVNSYIRFIRVCGAGSGGGCELKFQQLQFDGPRRRGSQRRSFPAAAGIATAESGPTESDGQHDIRHSARAVQRARAGDRDSRRYG